MKIFIVIPCYNEEAVLPKTLEVLGNLIKNIKVKTDADTELLLVDDGSRDRTWQMISNAAKEHRYVHGIKLSHNRGHQNALWAGMEAAVDHCDAMVSIDADLQDDENVIIDMVQQVQEGKDITPMMGAFPFCRDHRHIHRQVNPCVTFKSGLIAQNCGRHWNRLHSAYR